MFTFEKTPRQHILDYITLQGPRTITDISEELNIEPKKVRYEALRLVQLNKIEMKVEPNMDEPIFSAIID